MLKLSPLRNLTPQEFLDINEYDLPLEVVLVIRKLLKENKRLRQSTHKSNHYAG